MEVRDGYKQTEVGVIPRDWGIYELGKISKLKNGINKEKENFGFGYPFVNLLDVFGISTIDSSKELNFINSNDEERKLYSLRKGDILFVRSSVKPSGVGLTTLIKENLPNTVFSGFLIRYRDEGQISNDYKEYCFHENGFRNRLIANSTVSANTNINQEALKKLIVILPPTKAEQTAIAAALSDADVLIQSLEKLIAKQRLIKQGAMQELLKPKDGWVVKKLGEIGIFKKGKGIKKDEVSTEGYPCIRYGELYTHHDEYIKLFNSFINEQTAKASQRINKGDILFAGSGETKEEIGKCAALVDELIAYAGGDVIILTPIDCDSMFLGFLLNHSMVAKQKAQKAQGDAVVHIYPSSLSEISIHLPPKSEQTRIATTLSDMDAEISALETKLAKYKQIKQGMMQELLTGRIRLV